MPKDGRLLAKRGLSPNLGFDPNAGLEPKEGRFPALSKLGLRSAARDGALTVVLSSPSSDCEDDFAANRSAFSSSQGLVKLDLSGRFDSRVKGRRSRDVAAPEGLDLLINPVPTLRGLGMNLVIRPDVSPISLLSLSIAGRESVSVLGGRATARNAGSSPVT